MLVRVWNPEFVQRFYGLRHHSQCLSRLTELPARDRDHAIGAQVIEIFAEGFHGVKVVLAERIGPCCSGRPGID